MKILVAIDNGMSQTNQVCFRQALNVMEKNSDSIFLVNVYTSWDMLNDEKNAGRLNLSQFQKLAHLENVKHVYIRQLESGSPQTELLEFIKLNEIDKIFIGSNAFSIPAEENNLVFNAFSHLKWFITGYTSDYIKINAPPNVEVIICSPSKDENSKIASEHDS